MATGDTTNSMEGQITDVVAELKDTFSGQGGGALSGTFFASDEVKSPFSTLAYDINRQAEEVNFPLGRPVTGNEVVEQAASMTFGGQPITDPNGILNEFGPLDEAVASIAIETGADGISAYPAVAVEQLGEQAKINLATLEA